MTEPESPPAAEELPFIGNRGDEVPFARILGVPMRVENFTAFSTVNDGRVEGSRMGAYGLLTVALWTDPDAPEPILKLRLPVVHREDFKALHWLYKEQGLPPHAETLVFYSPKKFLGGFYPRLGIHVQGSGAEHPRLWFNHANSTFQRPK